MNTAMDAQTTFEPAPMDNRQQHCQFSDFAFHKTAILLVFVWLTLAAPVTASTLALLDGDVLFGAGETQLTIEGQKSLDSLTRTLRTFDGILSIRIIGHTDDRGDAQANAALSQRRADWLALHFIREFPGTHILSLGAGESIPLTSNTTAEGRARNRRVQVQVIASGNVP